MKHLVFLLLFTAAFTTVTAQSVTPRDTSYRVNVGGFFYLQRDVTYANGEQFNERKLLGDTAQLLAREVADVEAYSQRATNDAVFISQLPKGLRDITRLSDQTGTITGTTTLRAIQSKYDTAFTFNTYTVKDDSTQAIVFSLNAQGQLRYKIGALPTRNAVIYGPTLLVLNNYRDSGRDAILYRFPGFNTYQDIFRRVTVKRDGQPAQLRSREGMAPPTEEEAEAAPAAKTQTPAPTTKKATTKKRKQ